MNWPPKTLPRLDGSPIRRSNIQRRCVRCGKIVSKYNHPRVNINVICYACEDEEPWTYTLITGEG